MEFFILAVTVILMVFMSKDLYVHKRDRNQK